MISPSPSWLKNNLSVPKAPAKAPYVTGPRQAGKTTLARALAARAGMRYLTLDDQSVLAAADSDPHGLIRSLGTQKVVIDEFQHAPGLIPAIKEVSDQLAHDEKGRFLLTASTDIFRSARTQEALPGHMARLELFPLSLGEMNSQSRNIVDFLLGSNYQSPTLENPSREDIAHDLELDDRVVKHYIEILELMFIVRRVPAWLKNTAKRQATQMPKLHFIDTGLACHLLGLRDASQVLASQYYGGLLENLIFMELCKQASWAQQQVDIYHFRDNRNHEVDIVLEDSSGGITGIEIKASASVKEQDFKALGKLAVFAGSRLKHGVLFYTGKDILPFRWGDRSFYALPVGLFV